MAEEGVELDRAQVVEPGEAQREDHRVDEGPQHVVAGQPGEHDQHDRQRGPVRIVDVQAGRSTIGDGGA